MERGRIREKNNINSDFYLEERERNEGIEIKTRKRLSAPQFEGLQGGPGGEVTEEKTYDLTPGHLSTSILNNDLATDDDDGLGDGLDLSQISQASRGSIRYEGVSSLDESTFVNERDREEEVEVEGEEIQLLQGKKYNKIKSDHLKFGNPERKEKVKKQSKQNKDSTTVEETTSINDTQNATQSRGSRVSSGRLSSMTRFLKNSVTNRRSRNLSSNEILSSNNNNDTNITVINRNKRDTKSSSMQQKQIDLLLKIKTVADGKEYPISISCQSSVLQLKYTIMSTLKIENKCLRLIYQGKMLSPDTALLESFKIPIYIPENNRNNNENIELIQNEGPNSENNNQRHLQPTEGTITTTTTPPFVHCVISDIPPPQLGHLFHRASSIFDDTDNDALPIVDDIPPDQRRGLDTLRNYNLSQEEVMALRSYFAESINAYGATQRRIEGEEDNDRRYRIEEEWMARQGETSEYAVNVGPVIRRNGGSLGMEEEGRHRTDRFRAGYHGSPMPQGDSRDFTWGFILGFCLGIVMLFMLFIPDNSMSYQYRMGILVGVCCQLAWSIMARSLISEGNPDDNDGTKVSGKDD